MKKALISPNEIVNFFNGTTGYRIAQVELLDNIFSVAEPLYWIDCEDDVIADQFWFDPIDTTIKTVPIPPVPEPIGDAPNVIA